MRKLYLPLLTLLLLLSPNLAKADTSNWTEHLPPLKQGVAYSIEDGKFNFLSTVEVVKWKGLALEAGYAGAADQTDHKIVAVISYQIARLRDMGVTLPILDLVEFNLGVYGGYGRVQLAGDTGNDNEFDYGVSATLLNIKF